MKKAQRLIASPFLFSFAVCFVVMLSPNLYGQGMVIEEDLILKAANSPGISEVVVLAESNLHRVDRGEFLVYPNPAQSGGFVTIEGEQPIYSIMLMDTNAKMFAHWKEGRDSKIRITLPNLRAGNYLLVISTKQGDVVKGLTIQ